MAFQFLDKMANLIRMLSNTTRSEARVFRDLLSESTGHKVASAIRSALEPRSNRVAEILGKSVRLTYNRLHGHIVGDDGGPTLNQEQRTAHLRTLRNLGHGTELFDKKFEETFFGGSPTIPSELVHVPFFLALALGLNPAVVLSPTGDEPKAPTS
jgi:hypothetical protein